MINTITSDFAIFDLDGDTHMEVEDFCRKARDLISKAGFGRPITSHVSKVIQIFMKVTGVEY